MYAVFQDGSRQYQVSEGDQLDVDFRELDAGSDIQFDQVLLVSTNDGVRVGTPFIPDTRVVAKVLEQVRGEKIYVQKFKRRKNYHRRAGHRQQHTRVQVQQIVSAKSS